MTDVKHSECAQCKNVRDVAGDRIIEAEPDEPMERGMNNPQGPEGGETELVKCWVCQNQNCTGFLNEWDWPKCDVCGEVPDAEMKEFIAEYAPKPKKLQAAGNFNAGGFANNSNANQKNDPWQYEAFGYLTLNLFLFCVCDFFFCILN